MYFTFLKLYTSMHEHVALLNWIKLLSSAKMSVCVWGGGGGEVCVYIRQMEAASASARKEILSLGRATGLRYCSFFHSSESHLRHRQTRQMPVACRLHTARKPNLAATEQPSLQTLHVLIYSCFHKVFAKNKDCEHCHVCLFLEQLDA
jgi:hypothetical protein